MPAVALGPVTNSAPLAKRSMAPVETKIELILITVPERRLDYINSLDSDKVFFVLFWSGFCSFVSSRTGYQDGIQPYFRKEPIGRHPGRRLTIEK